MKFSPLSCYLLFRGPKYSSLLRNFTNIFTSVRLSEEASYSSKVDKISFMSIRTSIDTRNMGRGNHMNRIIRKKPYYNRVDNYLYLIIQSVLSSIHRKVAGSILDGVAWIFPRHNPSGTTLALRSTQPAIKMSTRVSPRG